jgi:hypothetical protein
LPRRSETVTGDGDRGTVEQPADLRVGIALESQRLRDLEPVGGHSGQAAGLVDHGLRCHGQAGSVDNDRDAVGIGGDHQQPVGAHGAGHEVKRPECDRDPECAGPDITE